MATRFRIALRDLRRRIGRDRDRISLFVPLGTLIRHSIRNPFSDDAPPEPAGFSALRPSPHGTWRSDPFFGRAEAVCGLWHAEILHRSKSARSGRPGKNATDSGPRTEGSM